MSVANDIALPAALTSLSPLAEWLAHQLASLPVDEGWCFALDLAACETATNIIRYALHEDARSLFRVEFITTDVGVRLRFTDAGAITVIVWKQYAWLDLYEIIPGFLFGSIAIVLVSLMGRKPSATMTERFELAEAEFKTV